MIPRAAFRIGAPFKILLKTVTTIYMDTTLISLRFRNLYVKCLLLLLQHLRSY